MTQTLDKLEEIKELRDVWPDEAADFTPWLAENNNITLLGEAIGVDIAVDETESSVGDFSVDIYAHALTDEGEETDRKIIIENQLRDTDHDHLGKLITYASGKSAELIVWVVKKARPEHRAAIEWLNNHTDNNIGFFLCEIKLYKIGNSNPAVKFNVVEEPNDWVKVIKQSSMNNATEQLRYEYWSKFANHVANNRNFGKAFKVPTATSKQMVTLSFGKGSCHIRVSQVQRENQLRVEIYIPNDKSVFAKLMENRTDIESSVGETIEWINSEEQVATRIATKMSPVDFKDQSGWVNQFDWIVEVALKMEKVVKKYL